MTDREIVRYINNLLKERKISLETVASYYSENESSFKAPEDFFSQNDENDYSKFYAIADLLSEVPEKVKDYFKSELKDKNKISTIDAPTDNDFMYILTSFVYFPEYFSLAYNWTSFIESRVGIGVQVYHSETDDSICDQYKEELYAASEAGFRQFGKEHSLGKYGVIWQKVCTDIGMKGIIFYITLSKEYQNKIVSFEITFETLADNKQYTVMISKNTEEQKEIIQSKTMKVEISKGIKVIKVISLK